MIVPVLLKKMKNLKTYSSTYFHLLEAFSVAVHFVLLLPCILPEYFFKRIVNTSDIFHQVCFNIRVLAVSSLLLNALRIITLKL